MAPAQVICLYARELCLAHVVPGAPFPRLKESDPLARWARVAVGRGSAADLRATWVEWMESHNPEPGTPFDA
jgi:hypothetical protein